MEPGQVFFVGDDVTLEAVGECEPCGKMDAIRQGLREELNHRRGPASGSPQRRDD